MKLTKLLHSFTTEKASQEFLVTVDFDGEEVTEIIDILALTKDNTTGLSQYVDILSFLDSMDCTDSIIDSVDWLEMYSDSKAELQNEEN